MAKPGELNEKIQKRMRVCGFDSFTPKAFPVVFWDVFGTSGHPVRATVSEMGPFFLAECLILMKLRWEYCTLFSALLMMKVCYLLTLKTCVLCLLM